MKTTKILALAAFAAMLSACGGGNGALQSVPGASTQSREFTTISAFTARNNVTGETVRIFPTRDLFQTFAAPGGRTSKRRPGGGSNLSYHGGPIQTAPKVYLVLWGSAWAGSGDPDGVAARLQSFYPAIGGSRWLNSVTQYTQSNGAHVGNSSSGFFVATFSDTASNPPNSPTQNQIAAEAAKAAAHFGDYSASASYVIALPSGISPSGFKTQYCAWHSSTSSSGGTIAYTNLPYLPDAGAGCGANSVNSNGILDGESIVGGHEQGETETDPQPNSGWLDGSGAENGDKCAWTNLINNPAAGGYPTQPLWSNANNGCVQSY